jgi:hypothetical protein
MHTIMLSLDSSSGIIGINMESIQVSTNIFQWEEFLDYAGAGFEYFGGGGDGFSGNIGIGLGIERVHYGGPSDSGLGKGRRILRRITREGNNWDIWISFIYLMT